MHFGGGCTTIYTCLIPLTVNLKIVKSKFYVIGVFNHNLKSELSNS